MKAPMVKWIKSTFNSATVNEVSNGKKRQSSFWATFSRKFIFFVTVYFSFVPFI